MKLNRKNKLLLLGALVMIYVSYSFAVSKTIGYYQQYQSDKNVIDSNAMAPDLAAQLKVREQQLDQLLSASNMTASGSFQNDLLKELSVHAANHHLKIIDFQEPHIEAAKNEITNYIFSLEGAFNGSMALLNQIENNPALGKIKHVSFTKKRNYKTNKDFLVTKVVLEKNSGNL